MALQRHVRQNNVGGVNSSGSTCPMPTHAIAGPAAAASCETSCRVGARVHAKSRGHQAMPHGVCMCAHMRGRLFGPAMLHAHLHNAVAAQLGPLALHEARPVGLA